MRPHLYEASAGTGKTFQLTQRVVEAVALDGLPIERILVVTFTDAATAELRSRIRQRLITLLRGLRGGLDGLDSVLLTVVDTARDGPGEAAVLQRVTHALRDFDLASISTIHGFCQQVLQRFAFVCGVSAEATLIGEPGPFLDAVLNDFWVRETATATPAHLKALGDANVTPKALINLAERLLRPPIPRLIPIAVGPAPEALRVARDALATVWRADGSTAIIDLDRRFKEGLLHPDRYPAATIARHADMLAIYLTEGAAIEPIPAAVHAFASSTLAESTRTGTAPPAHPLFTACQVLDAFTVDRPKVPISVAVYHRFARMLRQTLPRRLAEAGVRTFNGLLADVHAVLEDPTRRPALIAAVRSTWDCAFIDEFQDTDPLQWAIFSTLFEPARLTLIGDPKQSIYGFRSADLFAYIAVREQAKVESLDTNWRTDAPLVHSITRLFQAADPFTRPQVAIPDVKAAYDTRIKGLDGPPLRVRWCPTAQKSPLKRDAAIAKLAQIVADDVVATLAAGVTIEGEPLRAQDCAILVRTHAQASAVRLALEARGQAALLNLRTSVFHGRAAQDLMVLLAATLEPNRSDLVKRALATQAVGYTAVELAGMDANAWGVWAERLRAWRNIWDADGILPLVWHMLDDLKIRERRLCEEGGPRDVADLRHLGEALHLITAEFHLGPAALLAHLQTRAQDEADPGDRVHLARDGDAVIVATIHASKGLEHGWVFCPFAWTPAPNRSDRFPVFHADDDEQRLTVDIGPANTPKSKARRRQATEESTAEAMRLLYVALTRAKHRCTVYWGHFEGLDKGPLARLLSPEGPPRMAADSLRTLVEKIPHVLVVDTAPNPRTPVPIERSPITPQSYTRAPFDPTWRRTSFSGLTHDAHGDPPASLPEDLSLSDQVIPLAELAHGSRMGTFIHRVLELADFTDPDTLHTLVETQQRVSGVDADPAMLAAALAAMLQTPLTVDGPRLADFDRKNRLDELDFVLAVPQTVTPAALADAMRAYPGPNLPPDYPDRLAALDTAPFRGFLSGSIDLIFCHEGRWSVVDYKSNDLGSRIRDYAPAALDEAMTRSHYVLQAHLYAVALHRYLRWRLPNYDPEQHLGGVYYLFLRGMHPDHGAGVGVWHDRPPTALLDAWSALFDQGSS